MDALRPYSSALEFMLRKEQPPMQRDARKLPGGGTLGRFWNHCKIDRKWERPPYDRLLINPVLRDDYRPTR